MALRLPRLPDVNVEAREPELKADDVIKLIANTVDDVAEGIIGGRPASRILKALAHISPAATFERITGLPAPGKVIDALLDKAVNEIERFEMRVLPGARKAKRLEEEILE